MQRRHNRQSQEGERLLKENSCKEPRKRSAERNGEKNGRSAEERDPGRPTARKGPWARRIPRKPLAEASERGEGDPAGMAAAFRKEKSSERTSASAQGRFSREGRETGEKTEGAGKRDTRSEKGPQSVKEQDRKRRETHSSGSQTNVRRKSRKPIQQGRARSLFLKDEKERPFSYRYALRRKTTELGHSTAPPRRQRCRLGTDGERLYFWDSAKPDETSLLVALDLETLEACTPFA